MSASTRTSANWAPKAYLARPASGPVPGPHLVAAGLRHSHPRLQVADNPEQTLVYFTTDEVPAAKFAALAAEIG